MSGEENQTNAEHPEPALHITLNWQSVFLSKNILHPGSTKTFKKRYRGTDVVQLPT